MYVKGVSSKPCTTWHLGPGLSVTNEQVSGRAGVFQSTLRRSHLSEVQIIYGHPYRPIFWVHSYQPLAEYEQLSDVHHKSSIEIVEQALLLKNALSADLSV